MVDALATELGRARRIFAFTGAGLSTASGIPDPRGTRGDEKRRRPVQPEEFFASEARRIDYWDDELEGMTHSRRRGRTRATRRSWGSSAAACSAPS